MPVPRASRARSPWGNRSGRSGIGITLAAAVAIATLIPTACRKPAIDLVIVICVDTLRPDHLSSYGYARPTSPHLDDLASTGARFENAYSTSSWTVPAVASLLTSLEVFEHGAGVHGEIKSLSDDSPPVQFGPTAPHLAGLLSAAGVETALFGANPFLYGQFQEGFDVVSVERVDARALTERFDTWLSESSTTGKRFGYLHYMDVHQPNRPPDPYFTMFGVDGDVTREERHADWSWGQLTKLDAPGFEQFRFHRIGAYDGAIRYVDEWIGTLIQRLEYRRLLDRTLLIVTADHGEEFWDHAVAESTHDDDPRGVWGIGHGHTLYDELLAIPLIIQGPGIPPATVATCPVSLLDVAPTVLAAFGLESPEMGGSDLREIASGRAPCPIRPMIAGALAYGPDGFAMRSGDWKLILRRNRQPLLFELGADPNERMNLAASRSERVRELRRELARRTAMAPRYPTREATLDAERARELRSLGYLQ